MIGSGNVAEYDRTRLADGQPALLQHECVTILEGGDLANREYVPNPSRT